MTNKVIIIGRLTRDPDVGYVGESQQCMARFTLAVDRNTREKQTDFPQVTCFGKLGETVEKYCRKGMLICVDGKITTGQYTDKEGRTVYTTGVDAQRIDFLERREKKEEDSVSEQFEAINEALPF